MALELIYTSAPRGLRAGTSGYCTVAQTRGLREDLAAALERRSLFAHESKGESPVYFSFRNVSLGGSNWRVLSRARDAGLDFTGRRHFLVHHLILEMAEDVAGIQPAEILLGWKGWCETWNGGPEELVARRPEALFRDLNQIRLPAQGWKRETGDAAWAVAVHGMPSPVGWLAGQLAPEELLGLMGESTAVLEAKQKGQSWLVPLDVGGAANPVPKDCLWSGRTPWPGSGKPAGVRSVLRLEDCRGKLAGGPPEEILLARTGQGLAKTTSRVFQPQGGRPFREDGYPEPPRGSAGRKYKTRFLWILMVLIAIAVGGRWAWRAKEPTRPVEVEIPPAPQGDIRVPPQEVVAHPLPPPPVVSPGQALRQSFWLEAGGREPIERLHLLFGKVLSVALIEDELSLLLRDVTDARGLRGPEGPISLQTSEEQKRFCREVARRAAPWTLYVPEAGRGLAYLPDPSQGAAGRNIPAQGRAPGEILQDISRSIFLDPQRWSLLIQFPAIGELKFMPVRIVPQDENRLWITRVEQHRTQIQRLRQEAFHRLGPWAAGDPDAMDEREMRRLAKTLRGQGDETRPLEDFLAIDADYRRWWFSPYVDASPSENFRRLLRTPGVECVLELDGLAVGRLEP